MQITKTETFHPNWSYLKEEIHSYLNKLGANLYKQDIQGDLIASLIGIHDHGVICLKGLEVSWYTNDPMIAGPKFVLTMKVTYEEA